MKAKVYTVLLATAALAASAFALGEHPAPGMGSPGMRYATDYYPGFENDKDWMSPERKEPKWFSFINGPDCTNATEQMEHCERLLAEGDWSKARKQLDALVREWPTAPEAPGAQLKLAEVMLNNLLLYEDAFAEYRYLLDFYSLQCDYEAIADKLYQVAQVMKREGKEVMFIRFANTVDVRRAFEACVLRAPGAKWVPEAMLQIAGLREDEGKYEEAVKVYENLRSLHADSDEAKTALIREAEDRMLNMRERSYNRGRGRETIDFLRMALRNCRVGDSDRIRELLAEAVAMSEDEAYLGAKFYDSPTRTLRSAVNAYERFIAEHPGSSKVEEARARLAELKGELAAQEAARAERKEKERAE